MDIQKDTIKLCSVTFLKIPLDNTKNCPKYRIIYEISGMRNYIESPRFLDKNEKNLYLREVSMEIFGPSKRFDTDDNRRLLGMRMRCHQEVSEYTKTYVRQQGFYLLCIRCRRQS